MDQKPVRTSRRQSSAGFGAGPPRSRLVLFTLTTRLQSRLTTARFAIFTLGWFCPVLAMWAPLRGTRGTEILKSSCSGVPRIWGSSSAIWRRGLHISTPAADALDILPSAPPVPSTSGATPGLLKIQIIDRILILLKMPSSRSLDPHFLSSRFLSQPLKISTLGKVHWWE